MIILVHDNQKVVELYSVNKRQKIDYNPKKSIANILCDTAKMFPNELLIWVYEDYKEIINIDELDNIFHHKLIMASYAVCGQYSIPKQIGYVEQKPYTNVFRTASFPTWLMSSDIGGIYAETLNSIKSNNDKREKDFGVSLSSIAKQAMPKGLLCYSEPVLLLTQEGAQLKENKIATYQLFKFVKQHYKFVWTINLLLCFVIFEHKLPLLPFLRSLFLKPIYTKVDFNKIHVESKKEEKLKREVDVIIPTLGRKRCLYDVLIDLSNQTILPVNVIIVEQNPNLNATTELDYLTAKDWPFKIKHNFIHKVGVCNARNIALSLVESDWVLLGDDDNRFKKNLIENLFEGIEKMGCTVATTTYIQPNETMMYFNISQTDIFGSGNTMLKSKLLQKVLFDPAFEFGFGEDSDFGMQLRKIGCDIIFFPDIKITHLKAPIGGFRTRVRQLWDDDTVQPKPSPTIMLFAKKHFNPFQVKGYKYVLFLKFYKKQTIKNPFRYIKQMNAQWERSLFWAQLLYDKKSD